MALVDLAIVLSTEQGSFLSLEEDNNVQQAQKEAIRVLIDYKMEERINEAALCLPDDLYSATHASFRMQQ
jgi:hypothetical protein